MELADRILKLEAQQTALLEQLNELQRLHNNHEGFIRNHTDILELHDCMLAHPTLSYQQAVLISKDKTIEEMDASVARLQQEEFEQTVSLKVETGEQMLNRDAVARGICPHCGQQK